MSADNIIHVHRCKGGKWYVWEQSASNPPYVPENAGCYEDRVSALAAAHDLHEEYGYVEYGVHELTEN